MALNERWCLRGSVWEEVCVQRLKTQRELNALTYRSVLLRGLTFHLHAPFSPKEAVLGRYQFYSCCFCIRVVQRWCICVGRPESSHRKDVQDKKLTDWISAENTLCGKHTFGWLVVSFRHLLSAALSLQTFSSGLFSELNVNRPRFRRLTKNADFVTSKQEIVNC